MRFPCLPARGRTLLIGALAASLTLGCDQRKGDEPARDIEGGGRMREATRVRAEPIGQRDMVRVTSTTTSILSERAIEVFPRLAGIVSQIQVEEGDRVEAGDVLCVLDDRQAQADLADAQVALKEARDAVPRAEVTIEQRRADVAKARLTADQARREFERNEQAGLISANDLEKLALARDQAEQDHTAAGLAVDSAVADRDAAVTAIDRAQLGVDKAELDLSYTRVVASYPGVIASRTVEIGDSVSSGKALFSLVDPDRVRAVIYRPQRELALYRDAVANRESSPITIEAAPDAIPGEAYAGAIRIVSPTIDSTSGSVKLTIDLEQPSEESGRPRLLPGMLVRLTIVTDKHPGALVVPKRALRREGDRRFLFVVRDGSIARRVEVNEGFADDRDVEVIPVQAEELGPGDLVVVVGNRDLEDGEEVSMQGREDAPGEISAEPLVDALPEVRLEVKIAFDGAGADAVHSDILVPVEEAIRELPGFRAVHTEGEAGAARLEVTLALESDPAEALRAIRAGLAGLTLPEGASAPEVRLLDDDRQG